MGVRNEVERVVRESWREVRAENVTFMAGSIAYHAFVSMLPLLLFVLFVLSAVDNEALTRYLTELTASVLTPYARRLLVESFDATASRTGVSLVGAITLLWGTSKIFRSLDVAFSEIYDSDRKRSLLERLENAVVVTFSLTVAVAAFTVAGVVVAFLPDLPYPPAFNPVLLVFGLVVAFFPIYYIFPNVDLTPLEVVPGVVVGSVGWAALEAVFQTYVGYATRYEAVYGTLGSVLLLLVWLYFAGLVLLLGGVVNAVLAGRTGDEHALSVTEQASASESDGGRANSDRGRTPPGERDALARAYEDLGRAYERLDADRQHLHEEVTRLKTANERLASENDALTRRLIRRRLPFWVRVRNRLLGDRGQ